MPNIRTRFVAEGEKEYRQALKDINSGLGILNAESKKLQEQFKGNEDSLEALTATNENLDQIVLSLSDKLDLQKKRLSELSQAYGESDDRTQRMRKAVVETETALLKQQHALDENTKALDDFGEGEDDAADKAQGLGDALNDIGGKFGVSLPKEMTNTLNGMLNLDAQTLVLAGSFAAVAAAVVEAEKALISMTIESAAYADEILTQSVVTGLSTEALQEYQYAAELVDVSLDTLTSSQTKMIKSMDAARRGSKEQAEAFDKLGISVQNADGTLRDAQDVFGDAIDALGAISNETERDAIAMTIFGRSARDLNPLIKAGSDGLRELTQEAHDVGYVMGEEALDALGAVDDQLQRMNRSGEALKNQIAVGMAPAVENLMKKGTDLFVRLQEAAEGSGILEVFGALLDVVSALEPLFDVLFGTAEDGVPVLQTLLLTVLVLSIERAFAIMTAKGTGSLTKFVVNVKNALAANDLAKAQELCDKQKGSVGSVVTSALKKYAEMENNNELTKEQKLASIQKEVEEATALELPTLEMNLAVIATMTTLGTLIGLLGTVLGMIRSFAALATATGAPDSVALSTGISEALVNTAFGIATGACAVISYNFFTSKIDKLTYAIDEVGFSIVQSYAANHSK